jgi:nucleoside-diphosphate-sugar epimerase
MMSELIAQAMGKKCLTLPLPRTVLWVSCMLNQVKTNLTGRAHILSRQKFAEIRAPGWVCDPSQLERETGYICRTSLQAGIRETVGWYREQGWL